MTYEAELAKEVAIEVECKKHKLGQNVDGGWQLVINIHPDDMPTEILKDPMGQRYRAFFVPINEDETPKLGCDPSVPSRTPNPDAGQVTDKPVSHAGEGKLLAKDDSLGMYGFLKSTYSHNDTVEDWMKRKINIKSCSELIEGSEAYERFKEFRTDFYNWKRAQQQEEYYGR